MLDKVFNSKAFRVTVSRHLSRLLCQTFMKILDDILINVYDIQGGYNYPENWDPKTFPDNSYPDNSNPPVTDNRPITPKLIHKKVPENRPPKRLRSSVGAKWLRVNLPLFLPVSNLKLGRPKPRFHNRPTQGLNLHRHFEIVHSQRVPVVNSV